MRSQNRYQIDTLSVVYFLSLVMLGWINIYAADYDMDGTTSFFDLNQSSTRQLLWIGASFFLIVVIFILDYRFYDSFGYIIWGEIPSIGQIIGGLIVICSCILITLREIKK